MSKKKNKISKGLSQLINGKENKHKTTFSPVTFDREDKRDSYLESFDQALVVDIASGTNTY